jgi:uncharacterized protein YjbI with pentapeptide repeats
VAVAKHLDYLSRGTDYWNAWRNANPKIRPVLTGVKLEDRDFSGINFLKANLSGSDLTRAQLRGANLRYTDFSGCDLTGVDFEGANIMLADLTGAILTDAVGLSREQVDDALTDEATILPAGL